jgi:hypothetical protein
MSDLYGGFTRDELDAAFARVRPAGNWKGRINALLPATTSERELDAVQAAVTFFTGSVATVLHARGGWRVRAAGYYAAVGA